MDKFGAPVTHRQPNPFPAPGRRAPTTASAAPKTCSAASETAFDERRSMWLVGDWRIGKTTILAAWEKRLRERGAVVKLVSGQGPAGVSAAQFVETVTGLDSPPGAERCRRPAHGLDRCGLSPSGLPPVVLVDEVESVVQTCDVRFFDRLRDLLGRICLVFSSREAPDDVFASNNKGFTDYESHGDSRGRSAGGGRRRDHPASERSNSGPAMPT